MTDKKKPTQKAKPTTKKAPTKKGELSMDDLGKVAGGVQTPREAARRSQCSNPRP